jgi:predicted enzyme related to lactoylglutathione lyase
MPVIGEIMEVILYVQDMNVQVAFYRDVLGLKVRQPQQAGDFSDVYWLELETGPCVLALHGGGKRRFGEDAPKVVFRAADIYLARQTLIERGVSISEVRSPAPGVWVCDAVDPEGNHFSIEAHE